MNNSSRQKCVWVRLYRDTRRCSSCDPFGYAQAATHYTAIRPLDGGAPAAAARVCLMSCTSFRRQLVSFSSLALPVALCGASLPPVSLSTSLSFSLSDDGPSASLPKLLCNGCMLPHSPWRPTSLSAQGAHRGCRGTWVDACLPTASLSRLSSVSLSDCPSSLGP